MEKNCGLAFLVPTKSAYPCPKQKYANSVSKVSSKVCFNKLQVKPSGDRETQEVSFSLFTTQQNIIE